MTRLATVAAILAGTAMLMAARSGNSANQRDISEFVDAQGTFCWPDGSGGCVQFVSPIENFLGWLAPDNDFAASVDYAGLADRYLEDQDAETIGTTFRGSVTERPLADGRAEIHIRLHTNDALSWVADGNDFGGGNLLMGARGGDLLNPDGTLNLDDAAFGDSTLHAVIVNAKVGDPLPDLMGLIFDLFVNPQPGEVREIRKISFHASASGPLRAAFGVEEGTPGRLTVGQTNVDSEGMGKGVEDGFPAELVKLRAVGN
ncbi:MAG: hypothetical protein CMJ18_18405 [Phycisphaeraceae bacterium]|nr:hypothetical protein [Phycisphaeraceae bacterium]